MSADEIAGITLTATALVAIVVERLVRLLKR